MLIKCNSTMKAYICFIVIFASFHLSSCFMTFKDFNEGKLKRCYNGRGDTRVSSDIVNGQTQPLPSSLETFISLVEALEEKYPSTQPYEIIRKLLISFRVDDVPADYRVWGSPSKDLNAIERALFGIENVNYAWKDEDITDDEKCALHFMLSHSINDTLQSDDEEKTDDGLSKHPREYGVVSLYAKEKHAFALGKVLLGIYAGLSGNNQLEASAIYFKIKNSVDSSLTGVKFNRLIAATIGDLISVYISDRNFKRGEVIFMPNGVWDDLSCTTEYALEENNKRYITNSLVRGAIDGLLLGKKLEENQSTYKKMRLSQILRMYYGPTGLIDDTVSKTDIKSDTQWCKRMDNLRAFQNLNDELLNYYKLYTSVMGSTVVDTSASEINEVLGFIQGSSQILSDVTDEATECSRGDSSNDKCMTPFDIFPILDWQTNDIQKDFQIDLLGMLSTSLEIRPSGSSVGAYTNLTPMQTKGLHTIANNTGISGCPSCYARHFKRTGSSKQGEVEVFNNLNETLTEFTENQDLEGSNNGDVKTPAPAKVVLLFNFGSPVNEWRLQQAVWEVRKNFREATILAIGPKRESFHPFVLNRDTDIFTDTGNAATLAIKLKSRICRAPAEFQYKECRNGNEGDNKRIGFIPVNKKQYYAMYPKYFLKSYGTSLKFKALDGAQIKVCFSRDYYRIVEEGTQYKECRDAGEESTFTPSNPCHKYDEHNCSPFYFSIEGVKPAGVSCENIQCRTSKDIRFEFSHEGISCNAASFISTSSLLILLASIFILFKRH